MSEPSKCELCAWESGNNIEAIHDLITHMEQAHKDEVGKVISFHPTRSRLFNFYEVVGEDGSAVWGGNDPTEAIKWVRRSPIGTRLLASGWDSEGEDAHLVGQPLDITKVVYATLGSVL
jgi:hypothetical protein